MTDRNSQTPPQPSRQQRDHLLREFEDGRIGLGRLVDAGIVRPATTGEHPNG